MTKKRKNIFFCYCFNYFFFSFAPIEFLNIARNISLKFVVIILKKVGGDRFLMK